MATRFCLALIFTLAVSFAQFPITTLAADWGTLKGRFIVDGKLPAAAPPIVVAVPAACGAPRDESVVIGANGELANVVIFVREKSIDVNPKYDQTANAEVVLDNMNCRFEPHVLVKRTSQPLVLKNSDPLGHNVNATLLKNESFNDVVAPGAVLKKTGVTTEESIPCKIACNIHPWMQGIILIRANPYFAVSKADGTFEIEDLPAGKPIIFQFWQEKAGNLKNINGADGFATDAKGRADFTLKPGITDLGDIKIPARVLT